MAAPINDPVAYCLNQCGFVVNGDRVAIMNDGFADFDDFELPLLMISVTWPLGSPKDL